MSYDHPEFAGSKIHKKVLKPKDSATLILVRRDSAVPRILMGQRSAGHAFMPNKYVFPGGRLDAADCRVKPAQDLHPATLAKLMTRMRGRATPTRARGLAHAAVRETWEETGLLFGKKTATMPPISPASPCSCAPSRRRAGHGAMIRRFFVADAGMISNIDDPHHDGGGELLTLSWLTLDDIAGLDLPLITIDALKRLQPFLDKAACPPPIARPVSSITGARPGWRIRCSSTPLECVSFP